MPVVACLVGHEHGVDTDAADRTDDRSAPVRPPACVALHDAARSEIGRMLGRFTTQRLSHGPSCSPVSSLVMSAAGRKGCRGWVTFPPSAKQAVMAATSCAFSARELRKTRLDLSFITSFISPRLSIDIRVPSPRSRARPGKVRAGTAMQARR